MPHAPSRPVRLATALVAAIGLVLGVGGLTIPASAATTGLSGHVTDAETGAPLGDVFVGFPGYAPLKTASDGSYGVASLPTGTYRLCAQSSIYVVECRSVTKVDGQQLTADFALFQQRRISGVLTDASGSTVDGAQPVLYGYDLQSETWRPIPNGAGAPSRDGGHYDVSYRPGTYRLCFRADLNTPLGCAGGGWPDTAGDVVLGSADQARDVRLQAPAHFNGSLDVVGGDDTTGTTVSVERREPDGVGGTDWKAVRTVQVPLDGAGHGSFDVAVPAGTFRLVRAADDHVGQTTAPTTVVAGADVALGSVVLQRAPRVSGTITYADGHSDNRVVLVESQSGRRFETSADPDTGAYALTGLRPGTYRLEFNRVGDTSPYAAAQLYAAKTEGQPPTDLVLTAGGVDPVIDATLRKGGTIGGQVKDENGDGVPSAQVRAYTDDDSLVSRATYTDENGNFVVTGLSTGDYKVVVDRGNGPEYYQGSTTQSAHLTRLQANATGVSVTIGQPTTLPGTVVYDSTKQQVHADGAGPTLSAASYVGEVATVDPGSYDVPVTLTYQWFRNGVPIGRARGVAYTPVAADVGQALTVLVTATPATGAYREYVTTLSSTAAYRPLSSTGAPVVSGTPAVGQKLTADRGTWSTTTDVEFAFQWLSAGVPVPGATQTTYTPGVTDAGHRIEVVVTATRGTLTATRTSVATAAVPALPVPAPATITGTLSVSGKAAKGKTLVAAITNPLGAGVTYQWFRTKTIKKKRTVTVAIPGATAASYRLKGADQKAKVFVVATLTKAGATTLVLTSAAEKVK